MSAVIDHPATLALGATLLHFLWQGLILGFAAYVILRYARLSPGGRYTVGVVTLAVMLAAPAATFAVLASRYTSARHDRSHAVVTMPVASSSAATSTVPGDLAMRTPNDMNAVSIPADRSDAVAWTISSSTRTALLSIWFAGVIVLSLRLLGGWIVARRMTARAIRPVAPEIQSIARRVAGRLALDRAVRVVESSAVAVPAMIGWMKPVVLLPAAALAGLSPAQIEALIAHELAHVRRHDYLINLLQTIVETLLFYHPAVWWVSRQVRAEREHCCDDLAVEVCDRLTYVTALAHLAAASTRPRFAMAATGGSLLGRVRRILGRTADHDGHSGWLAAVTIVTIAGVVVAGSAMTGPARGVQQPAEERASVQAAQEEQAAEVEQSVAQRQAAEAAEAQALVDRARELARLMAELDQQRAVAVATTANEADRAKLEALIRVLRDVEAATAEQDQRARQERERVLEQVMKRDAAELERVLEMQRRLDQQRIDVELRAHELQAQARMSTLEAELQAAREALQRARQQVEAGAVDRSVMAKAELQLRNIENQLTAAMAERELLKANAEIRIRESELKHDSERRRAEIDRAMRQAMEQYPGQRAAYDELARKVQELERLLQMRAEVGAEVQQERARLRSDVVTNPNEETRPGDLLVIEIAGEPELPRDYQVRADGTIRLPLIGSVRVGGLTAGQVREAVAKRIIDRGLGTSPSVAVSLRRPRGE